jgi:hypothetical protein
LSMARFIIEASNGLRNNSGKTVIISMRIIYFLGCKGTKFFFRSYFQHSITILRSATGFFYAPKGASVGRSFRARKNPF